MLIKMEGFSKCCDELLQICCYETVAENILVTNNLLQISLSVNMLPLGFSIISKKKKSIHFLDCDAVITVRDFSE